MVVVGVHLYFCRRLAARRVAVTSQFYSCPERYRQVVLLEVASVPDDLSRSHIIIRERRRCQHDRTLATTYTPRWRQQYKPVHGHDVGGRVAAMPCLEIHSLLHGPRACGGRQQAGKRSRRRP